MYLDPEEKPKDYSFLKILIFIALAAILLFISVKAFSGECKPTEVYSYQGMVDPAEVISWTLKEDCTRYFGALIEAFYVNPKPSEIPVGCVLFFQDVAIAYAYLYKGEPYLFYLNYDTICYEAVELDQERKDMFIRGMKRALDGKTL